MTSVYVVDDEAIVRSGIAMILRTDPGIQTVGTGDQSDALSAVQRLRPDVVLLDVRMPQPDGLHLLRSFMGMPNPPVVAMLTTFDTDAYLVEAIRNGAAGYVLKSMPTELLTAAVHTLAAGGTVLSPGVNRRALSHDIADRRARVLVDQLTNRERTVLRLLAAGLTNQEIAQQLHLSYGTVKDVVATIFAKLEVSNRVLAALTAERARFDG